ncbi:cupin domain-containing protein [Desmospora activa]|uniref:Cupin domain-containing protein n=1 Tax=Desmospora activa DSM 45169 TaxID=1121389 RepID=A0A2T4Z961_9BACL|nr:cupin domain-containing protein [Desmospora activa]PTM58431.1 Cupin domain-containing protein [Desmospora activa DSM 45169]
MEIKVLDPFKDGKTLWLGLDNPGMVRKVFQMVTPETVGSKHLMAGLTIFEPGEASSVHNHPESEELNIVIRGSGEVISGDEKRAFKQNDYMFIPEGVYHQHVNTGTEPLWLLWAYTPQGSLPKN